MNLECIVSNMQIATLAIALIGCIAKMVQLEWLDRNIWACSRGTVTPCSFIMHVCSPVVPSLFVSSGSESSQTYWRLHSSCSIDFPWRSGVTKPIGSYVETCAREDTAFRVYIAPQKGIRNYRIHHTIELLGCILGGLHQILDPSFFNTLYSVGRRITLDCNFFCLTGTFVCQCLPYGKWLLRYFPHLSLIHIWRCRRS